MNSTTSIVARQYRLQQWAEQIRECQNRPADMSVKEWCQQQAITVANYYYRLREVRKACLESIPVTESTQKIVPVPMDLMNRNSIPEQMPGLDVAVNGIRIHVTDGTSQELLRMVLQVAANVE